MDVEPGLLERSLSLSLTDIGPGGWTEPAGLDAVVGAVLEADPDPGVDVVFNSGI